jgi:WD40 repeat protein
MRGTPIAMACSPDGERIALALDLRRIGLYDATSLTLAAVLESPRTAPLWHLAFSPDSRLLASASPTNEIRLWDLELLARELARHGLGGLAGR